MIFFCKERILVYFIFIFSCTFYPKPLNVIDSGRLLKSLVAGMTAGAKPEEKQKQSGLVARLMEAFEQSQNEPSFYEVSTESQST